MHEDTYIMDSSLPYLCDSDSCLLICSNLGCLLTLQVFILVCILIVVRYFKQHIVSARMNEAPSTLYTGLFVGYN
jgi:mannose/fructose/N-acetylgalactosamine-specific phosphotransferase system component IIC